MVSNKHTQFGYIESGAQFVSPEGVIRESYWDKNSNFFSNLESQMEKLKPGVDFVTSDKDESVVKLDEKSGSLDLGTAINKMQAIVKRDIESTQMLNDDPSLVQGMLKLTRHNEDGASTTTHLSQENLNKLNVDTLQNATLSWGSRMTLEIKNGQLDNITDGMEDYIPEEVMNHAALYAKENNVTVNVVPFTTGKETAYMFTDMKGNIMKLNASEDSPEVEIGHANPNEPTYNPSGNGNDILLGENSSAPHIDNPVEKTDQTSVASDHTKDEPVYGYVTGVEENAAVWVEKGSDRYEDYMKKGGTFYTADEYDKKNDSGASAKTSSDVQANSQQNFDGLVGQGKISYDLPSLSSEKGKFTEAVAFSGPESLETLANRSEETKFDVTDTSYKLGLLG